jgi:hypothetical protein
LKQSNHHLERSVLSLSIPSSAVDSKHFVRTGGFFLELSMGIEEANDDDLDCFSFEISGMGCHF